MSLLMAVACLLSFTTAGTADLPSDTFVVEKENELLSNVDIALALSQGTSSGADQVVIARDDNFADALASGVLQADGPLLLVPSVGSLPPTIVSEFQRLGTGRAVVLGGEQAVSTEIAAQIASLGIEVERRAGADRIATATEVARQDAPSASTAILVRAYGASTSVSSAFADSLPAGALSARTGYPVLLSETARLSDTTRDYLIESRVESVLIVGGTAALSEQVDSDLADIGIATERIAGSDRFETAIQLVGKTDPTAATAADVDEVILIDGTGANAWAGGFAVAHRAAIRSAPVLLTSRSELPAATQTFLSIDDPSLAPSLTCVQISPVCESARQIVGLPPAATFFATPEPLSSLAGVERIEVSINPTSISQVSVSGTCVANGPHATTQGVLSLEVLASPPEPCTVDLSVNLEGGTTQSQSFSYNVQGGQLTAGEVVGLPNLVEAQAVLDSQVFGIGTYILGPSVNGPNRVGIYAYNQFQPNTSRSRGFGTDGYAEIALPALQGPILGVGVVRVEDESGSSPGKAYLLGWTGAHVFRVEIGERQQRGAPDYTFGDGGVAPIPGGAVAATVHQLRDFVYLRGAGTSSGVLSTLDQSGNARNWPATGSDIVELPLDATQFTAYAPSNVTLNYLGLLDSHGAGMAINGDGSPDESAGPGGLFQMHADLPAGAVVSGGGAWVSVPQPDGSADVEGRYAQGDVVTRIELGSTGVPGGAGLGGCFEFGFGWTSFLTDPQGDLAAFGTNPSIAEPYVASSPLPETALAARAFIQGTVVVGRQEIADRSQGVALNYSPNQMRQPRGGVC